MQGVHLRKHNVEAVIDFELYEVDGIDLRIDWTPAAADCEVQKDGGDFVQCTNTAVVEDGIYSITLTNTEMSAARIVVKVVDAATKVFLDKIIVIETYGNASAQHAFDLDTAIQDVNTIQISGDSTAADNAELQFDGTGLTGDTFPATQAQVGNLSTGSAAISTVVTSTEAVTPVVTGTPTLDYTKTIEEDEVYHSWVPDGGALEFAYNFNIGPNASPVDAIWVGYCQSINDEIGVYARNWVGGSWEQVGTIEGTVGTTQQTVSFNLTTSHVNTGANSGDVRIRFQSTGGPVITVFATDRMLLSYTITNQSVGYSEGAIWFDDIAANTNTVAYVDGVADNPVSTWAAVKTLIVSTGITKVHIANSSSVTLDANSDKLTLFGTHWNLDLNGQSIDSAVFDGAEVVGTGVVSTGFAHFTDCEIQATVLPPGHLHACGLVGDIVIGTGDYFLDQCYSAVAGTSTPGIDF
ncbi:hypothetical protein KAR91_06485, partial [Candidatus Pacearchaeota archaeon]|nr:hypothetical protein [Candidatus Pacearchaeota archaeon]